MAHVQAPDGTVIEFPDSMKDADIESAMGRLYPAPKTWLDDVGDTVKQYWSKVNPATQAVAAGNALLHPVDAVKSYMQGTGDLAQKAKDAFHAGNYTDAARHAVSYVLNGVPGLGSAVDEAGDKAGSGDYKGAIADTAALATNLVAMKLAPGAAASTADAVTNAAPMISAGIKAGAKDVGVGSVKAAAGAALAKAGPLGEIGDVIAGVPIVKSGLKQIGQGVRSGIDAARAASRSQLEAAAARLRVPTPVENITVGSGGGASPQAAIAAAPVANITPASYAPPVTSTGPLPTPPAAPAALPSTLGPEGRIATPGVPTPNASPYAPPVTSTGPLPSAAAPPFNPYSGSTISPAALDSGARMAAGRSTLVGTPRVAPVQAAAATPEVTTIPPAKAPVPAAVFKGAAQVAKGNAIAKILNEGGISYADAAGMNDEQWAMAEKAAGVKTSSATSRANALFALKKLELPKPSPALTDALKKPGAMSAAQQLADLMSSPK